MIVEVSGCNGFADVGTRAGENGHALPHRPRPIFVIGSRRSGASLLTTALGQHAAIRQVPDTTWIERFARGTLQTHEEDAADDTLSQFGSLGVTLDRFFEELGTAIDRLMLGPQTSVAPTGAAVSLNGTHPTWQDFGRMTGNARDRGPIHRPHRWVDGCYTHTFITVTLHRMFPEARFIHVVRDVNEVVSSLTDPANEWVYKSQHLSFSVRDAYEHWLDAVTAGLEAERALGSGTVLRISRRQLTAEPEATMHRCLDFLGEPFDQRCLRPFDSVPAHRHDGRSKPHGALDGDTAEIRRQAETLSFALMASLDPGIPRLRDERAIQELVDRFAATTPPGSFGD